MKNFYFLITGFCLNFMFCTKSLYDLGEKPVHDGL